MLNTRRFLTLAVWFFLILGSLAFVCAPEGSMQCYGTYQPGGGNTLPTVCVMGQCTTTCHEEVEGGSPDPNTQNAMIECECIGDVWCHSTVLYSRHKNVATGVWGPWEFIHFNCIGDCDPNGNDACYLMAPPSGQGMNPGDRFCGCT